MGIARPPEDLIKAAMAQRGMPAPASAAPSPTGVQQPPTDQTAAVAAEVKKQTDQAVDQAKKDASAKGVDEQAAESPAVIKLKRKNGDQEEEMAYTESQLLGMVDRYKGLNFKHARLKPVIQLAEQLLESADPRDPEAAAKLAHVLQTSLQAQLSNPKVGKGAPPAQEQMRANGDGDGPDNEGGDDFDWDGWEKENALNLPPMLKGGKVFKETNSKIDRLGAAVAQLAHMIQSAMGQGQVMNQQTQQAMQGAATQVQDQRATAMRDMIGANLTRAQQAFSLPDDAAQEFLQFAGQRGYGFEDFLDPELTQQVVGDFARSRQEPEYQRMRDQMSRRQAVAGSVAAAPTGGGAGGVAQPPGDAFINRMVAKRFG